MNTNCLSERDLVLMHYGEAPDGATPAAAAAHLSACSTCQARMGSLAADLTRIPVIAEPHPSATTRVAARVTARLTRKRRWLPIAGAATAGAIALAMAIVVWMPSFQQQPATSSPQLVTTSQQPALDLDLLEQLDLLEELETLQDIEGV